jgi:hypothetical protein
VIRIMAGRWKGDEKMAAFLTLETLFRPGNFNRYNAIPEGKKEAGADEFGYPVCRACGRRSFGGPCACGAPA